MVLYRVHWSERLRDRGLKCAVVLVNSEMLTQISFLKNHITGFLVPGCVEWRVLTPGN